MVQMKTNDKPELTVKFARAGRGYENDVLSNIIFGNTSHLLRMIPHNRIGKKYDLLVHIKNDLPVEITIRALTRTEFDEWKYKNRIR